MQTATLTDERLTRKAALSAAAAYRRLGWLITIPLVFFAAHGTFSFQTEGEAVGGALPGAVTVRNPGFVGYVLLPGLVYGIVFWLMKARWKTIVSYASQFKMLTLLGLLTIVSALWSQDPSRSALFGTFYFIGTLFAYYLVIQLETYELMTIVSRACVVVCIIGVILVIFFPQYGVYDKDPRAPGAWRGIFIDRTGAAKELVFLFSPAIFLKVKRSKSRWLISLGLPLLMIFKAHATTALVILFLYFLVWGALKAGRKLGRKLTLAVLVGGSIVLGVTAVLGIQYLPDILRSMGRDPTLTGRTLIWAALKISILKRPILGYGFYAFWQGLSGESGNVITALNWSFGYAHNGILEVFLQLGSVGVAVLFVTLVQAIRNAWFCYQNDRTGKFDWYIALIVLTIFYNVDEETLLFPNALSSMLYIIACCGLAQGAWQLRRQRHITEASYN
jgi:O-antigen ligase